jgi:hypothetical protein
MKLEQLMQRFAQAGATAIIKVDHERFAEHGEPWTLVISGPALGDDGFVRAEEATLAECLKVGLSRLQSRGHQWQWVTEFMPE